VSLFGIDGSRSGVGYVKMTRPDGVASIRMAAKERRGAVPLFLTGWLGLFKNRLTSHKWVKTPIRRPLCEPLSRRLEPGSNTVARKKTSKIRVNVKASVSRRLREIRQEKFGDHGGPELARRLNLPARTWYNYETGVTVPAEILLAFIDETGANPLYLLSGEGSKYRSGLEDTTLADLSPIQLIRRGLEKLEQYPNECVVVAPENLPSDVISDFVAITLVSLSDLAKRPGSVETRSEGHILAYRKWLPHPRETVGVRLIDDAMAPILPAGSVVAVDRAVTDPGRLQDRMVAACPEGEPMIRWLDVSGRHLILRPNQASREHPLIPIELDSLPSELVLGQVVWSWSCFNGGS